MRMLKYIEQGLKAKIPAYGAGILRNKKPSRHSERFRDREGSYYRFLDAFLAPFLAAFLAPPFFAAFLAPPFFAAFFAAFFAMVFVF